MNRIRRRLTYSNVMVTILAFVVLGGGAYAAFHLPKNSVRSRNIVNHQVKSKDLASAKFNDAGLEDFPGSCGALTAWFNVGDSVSYARDGFGFVHLRGGAKNCGAVATIFKLPLGFRPARDQSVVVPTGTGPQYLGIEKTGNVTIGEDLVSLAGITFRCGPSGKNGCP